MAIMALRSFTLGGTTQLWDSSLLEDYISRYQKVFRRPPLANLNREGRRHCRARGT